MAQNMKRQPETIHDCEVQTNRQVKKSWKCRFPRLIAMLTVCVGQRRWAGSAIYRFQSRLGHTTCRLVAAERQDVMR